MKKLILVTVIGLAGLVASAQTNSTILPTGTGGTWSDIFKVGDDLYVDLIEPLNLDTNDMLNVAVAAGVNTSDNKPVVALQATVPVSSIASVGFIGGYAHNDWYEGGVGMTIGATNNLPILGSSQEVVGDGVVWDFRTQSTANYAYTSYQKYWNLSSQSTLSAGVVIANTSTESGVDVLGNVAFTFHF